MARLLKKPLIIALAAVILLVIGLFLWIIIIYRAIRSRRRTESKFNMPWLFFYSGLAIPAF